MPQSAPDWDSIKSDIWRWPACQLPSRLSAQNSVAAISWPVSAVRARFWSMADGPSVALAMPYSCHRGLFRRFEQPQVAHGNSAGFAIRRERGRNRSPLRALRSWLGTIPNPCGLPSLACTGNAVQITSLRRSIGGSTWCITMSCASRTLPATILGSGNSGNRSRQHRETIGRLLAWHKAFT